MEQWWMEIYVHKPLEDEVVIHWLVSLIYVRNLHR
jgi:hypothetical protein